LKREEIVAKIVAALPDARVELEDLTGSADHWKATIVSAAFTGRNLIQRHRLVFAALEEEMRGPIHALSLDVRAPDEVTD
jgi:stress-induced morphogen